MSVTTPAPRLHWIVTTHWVIRSVGFLIVLLLLAIHLWVQEPPLWAGSCSVFSFCCTRI